MALGAQCPNCMARLRAQDSYLGKSLKCPKCGKKFIVKLDDENDLPEDSHESSNTEIGEENHESSTAKPKGKLRHYRWKYYEKKKEELYKRIEESKDEPDEDTLGAKVKRSVIHDLTRIFLGLTIITLFLLATAIAELIQEPSGKAAGIFLLMILIFGGCLTTFILLIRKSV